MHPADLLCMQTACKQAYGGAWRWLTNGRGQPISIPGCYLQRTGIRQRHILGRNENLSDHAAKSAQLALEMAGVAPEDVDMILLATSSPDDLFGSACQVIVRSAGGTDAVRATQVAPGGL